MDLNSVDRAFLVCAQIDHNPDNNTYIATQAAMYPDRIVQVADLDSFWSSTYHTAGSAERLSRIVAQWPIRGFTHYLHEDDRGEWLHSDEGVQLFQVAAANNLIVSLSCHPHQQAAIRTIARQFPSIPILCHHLSHIQASEGPPHAGLKEVLSSASVPNIYIKVSGFAYCSQVEWDYPYHDTRWILRTLYEHFGPHRMCWGSDYPVVRFYMTYRQSLEVLRTHCPFIPERDKEHILGKTLASLLAGAQGAGSA